ncbi:MAG: hypothetical protein J2P36_04635 [Ktedonobacteraceae bacterium]|nr:hypothetical protein [Ktedonobacteraceae bacterium]
MTTLSYSHGRPARQRGQVCSLLITFLLLTILLVACSGPGGDANSTTKNTPTATTATGQVKWCSKPSMLFRDEAAPTTPAASSLPPPNGTPTTITDWSVFKANVGFTIYLPTTLPAGACLVSAFGTLRDPIMGGNFTIGYQLPNNDSISLSEAPLRSQGTAFQCSVDTTQNTNTKKGTPTPTSQTPVQLCSGAHDKTNIVFSARGTTGDLQHFFDTLQTDVNWIPAS